MLFREIPDYTFIAIFIKIKGASFSVLSLDTSAAPWTVFFSHFPSLIMWKLVSNPSAPIPFWVN